MGVPPHAFISAPSRAIDNAVSIPIERVASVGPMPAGRYHVIDRFLDGCVGHRDAKTSDKYFPTARAVFP